MKKIKKILFIYMCCSPFSVDAATIVYNLRVAEATKRSTLRNVRSIAALTVFDQFRKKYDGADQGVAGLLATYIYNRAGFFGRVDTAIGHVSNKQNGVCFSRMQSDDILLSAGYSYNVRKDVGLTFSGLFGFPTHQDTVLQGIQFGVAHTSLGVQLDTAYHISDRAGSLLNAARFVHFFPRNTSVMVPVAGASGRRVCRDFNFHVGNLMDLLFSYQKIWERNRIEIGYNPGFAFGARIEPDLPTIADQTNFIRNSFYCNYARGFVFKNRLAVCTSGVAYSFDSKPKDFGLKRIVSLFANIAVGF